MALYHALMERTPPLAATSFQVASAVAVRELEALRFADAGVWSQTASSSVGVASRTATRLASSAQSPFVRLVRLLRVPMSPACRMKWPQIAGVIRAPVLHVFVRGWPCWRACRDEKAHNWSTLPARSRKVRAMQLCVV